MPWNILVIGEVERSLLAGDMKDVAESFRRDQPDPRTALLQHDVGGNRCSVEHPENVLRPCAGPAAQLFYAGNRRARRIVRRGRDLLDRFLAGTVVAKHEIGESATDINPDLIQRPLGFSDTLHTI